MSLLIETDDITAVLLADGWHEVTDKSFDIDSLEFVWGKRSNGDWHTIYDSRMCDKMSQVGATWAGPDGERFDCPLTSVLAVKRDYRKKKRVVRIHDEPEGLVS